MKGDSSLISTIRAQALGFSETIYVSSMAKSGQKQLVPLHIEEVDHTIISYAQAKLWPALESPVGEGFQATPQITNIGYYPGANSRRQFVEDGIELA